MKVLDFLHSRTFLTHLTGLASIAGTAIVIPNSHFVSLAIALLTGITQAAHAYQAVQSQGTVDVSKLGEALGPLLNAAGTVAVDPGQRDTEVRAP